MNFYEVFKRTFRKGKNSKIGDTVVSSRGFPCHTCGIYRDFQITEVHRSPDGKHTYSIACPECGEKWWNSNVEEETIDSLANY